MATTADGGWRRCTKVLHAANTLELDAVLGHPLGCVPDQLLLLLLRSQQAKLAAATKTLARAHGSETQNASWASQPTWSWGGTQGSVLGEPADPADSLLPVRSACGHGAVSNWWCEWDRSATHIARRLVYHVHELLFHPGGRVPAVHQHCRGHKWGFQIAAGQHRAPNCRNDQPHGGQGVRGGGGDEPAWSWVCGGRGCGGELGCESSHGGWGCCAGAGC